MSESGGVRGLAGESLLRASEEGAAFELAYADVTGHEGRERHAGTGELLELHPDADSTVDLRHGSLALQPADPRLASHDQPEVVAGFGAPKSAGQRFTEWSLRYVTVLAAVDALVGGAAAGVSASISETLSANQAVPLLCLLGLLFWPAAVGLERGYCRARIGVGFDEFRAVMLAGLVAVATCAVPAGFAALRNDALSPQLAFASPFFAFLSVAAVGAPIAVVMSVMARILARRLLHRQQEQGRNIRRLVVAGSAAAAQQLIDRIQREPQAGMKIVGVCLPSTELPRPIVDTMPVLGNLEQVAEVVRALDCDVVAVTSDDATRFNYLRRLAWSLEGAEVELLVDPGLEEIAGPRLQIRPLTGAPLVYVRQPRCTGWHRKRKRVGDVVLASLGLVLTAPVMLIIAAVVKAQDRGPVIFRQTRVGRGGEPFTLL